MDLPATALDLIDRFLNSRTYADVPLPSESSYRQEDYLTAPAPPAYASSNASITLTCLFLLAAVGVVMLLVRRDSISSSKAYSKQQQTVTEERLPLRSEYQTLDNL